MKPLVFVPEAIGQAGMAMLADHCDLYAPWDQRPNSSGDPSKDQAALCKAAAAVVRIFPVDGAAIEAAPELQVIAKHGVGVDNIDIVAATARGIPVLWSPGCNANAVAEHTLALMLTLARRIGPAERAARDGWQVPRTTFTGVELAGRTLGIVGLGRIGKRLAIKAVQGMGMTAVAYDPYVDVTDYPGPARLVESLEDLCRIADVVSFHVPLTPETRHMVDARSLDWLQTDALLINTSRGAVVDETAVADALHGGRLGGAALDVFAREPLPSNHPLVHAPNTVLTPHIAGQTMTAMQIASRMACQGVLDVFAGRRPRYVVNPEVF